MRASTARTCPVAAAWRRAAIGVLTVDHEGAGGTVETEAGEYLLVYAGVTADVQDNEEVGAELQAASSGPSSSRGRALLPTHCL